jgi:8-oxo-dGTP diphosphatase
MPVLAVNIAIQDNQKVLLTKRADFEVWCLPGGSVDPGESVVQAARREAREEVGLEVELTGLVGIYSRPGWMDGGIHVVLFRAVAANRVLSLQAEEVLEAGYFGLDELPQDLMFGHLQRIKDALAGVGGGLAWLQDAAWPFDLNLSRQELYERCQTSGLSKAEFYFRYVGNPGPAGERLELG